MMNDQSMLLEKLMNWYRSNCDGDWEHSYQIKIFTIDNPGWGVEIDLAFTGDFKEADGVMVENSEHDWFYYRVQKSEKAYNETDLAFIGSGGAGNLGDILNAFFDIVKATPTE